MSDLYWWSLGSVTAGIREDIEAEILNRLALGILKSGANHRYKYRRLTNRGEEFVKMNESVIPPAFWVDFLQCALADRSIDFQTGCVDFRLITANGATYGHAEGLKLLYQPASIFRTNEQFVPRVFNPAANVATIENGSKGKGRPTATWWPDFAEELAIYLHDNGPPSGTGTDGQSGMIEAIFERMTRAGKGEPSRTTVQPVVNAVLRRIRSAGK